MKNLPEIRLSDYNYPLPEEKIASYPLKNRPDSKLLIYQRGEIKHSQFNTILNYLNPTSLLVMNNSKVIYARLHFYKKTGSKIELFCLQPYQPSEYNVSLQKKGKCLWLCMVGNLKKWKDEMLELKFTCNGKEEILKATKYKKQHNNVIIQFDYSSSLSFSEVITNAGTIPIPPYLERESESIDQIRYQTVYSKIEGSVAAPTAGLHFTTELLEKAKNSGIKIAEITLHVGAGTFLPVKEENVLNHPMHTEFFYITKEFLQLLLEHKGPVVSVGTTSARTLESIYWLGMKIKNEKISDIANLHIEQFIYQNYFTTITPEESINTLLTYMEKNNRQVLTVSTSIMIIPGYKFKIVNQLITNFHQPASTLLLLVSAFIGDDWKKIYDYALKNNFRFLSYGDSSLLIPTNS